MKVRTHKTIKFRWALTVAGEVVDLTGRNLVVEITTPGKQKVVLVPQIENNVLCFEYKGTQVGTYSMTAYLDRYTQAETMLDKCKAFTLVEKTCMEEDSAAGDLQYETIELEGSLSMVPMGPKGDPGPIGPKGNPATINGYETLTVTPAAPITIAQVDGTLTIGLDPDKSVTPEDLNEEIQNRIKGDNDIKKELGTKQDTLTPGTGIKIENNVISSTGGGGGSAIWTGTESEYNELETIDPEMIYIVKSD